MQRSNAFQKCHPACLFEGLFCELFMTPTQEKYRLERQDPRWQKRRLEIMQRDDFQCRDCKSKSETLNVHHAYYVTGRRCWDYPSFSLETLCWECHKLRHFYIEKEAENNDTLPEDEKIPTLQSWETQLDWMLDGLPCDGGLWYIAAEMAQAWRVIERPALLKKLENFLTELRREAEGAK